MNAVFRLFQAQHAGRLRVKFQHGQRRGPAALLPQVGGAGQVRLGRLLPPGLFAGLLGLDALDEQQRAAAQHHHRQEGDGQPDGQPTAGSLALGAGFGTRLLKSALTPFDGKTEVAYLRSGVHCTMQCRVPRLEAER